MVGKFLGFMTDYYNNVKQVQIFREFHMIPFHCSNSSLSFPMLLLKHVDIDSTHKVDAPAVYSKLSSNLKVVGINVWAKTGHDIKCDMIFSDFKNVSFIIPF